MRGDSVNSKHFINIKSFWTIIYRFYFKMIIINERDLLPYYRLCRAVTDGRRVTFVEYLTPSRRFCNRASE